MPTTRSLLRTTALLCACVLSLAAASSVPMSKNGNIRYGPSLQAGVIVTLKAGEMVDLLGPVPGKQGWYRIRFPEQGHAWIHEKVVEPVPGDPERLRVVVEGARVRSDATIGGELVTDLAVGDEVLWKKGRTVGSWYAVSVPSATAYVYHSVLDLDAAHSGGIAAASGEDGRTDAGSDLGAAGLSRIERLWREVQNSYVQFYQVYQSDRARAATLDWQGLLAPLKQVVEEHPDLRTRLVAQRLRTSIVRKLHAGTEPITPDKIGVSQQQVPQQKAPAQQQPARVARQEPVQEEPVQQQPVQEEPVQQQPVQQQQPQPPQAVQQQQASAQPARPGTNLTTTTDGTVAEGWIEPQEIPALGVRYVVLGDEGVAAFITLPDGSDIDLRQLFWKRVRVTGQQVPTETGMPPEYAAVPTIAVEDIRIVSR
ncbi:MAG: SH3 domain-containing protein [Planctomycetota bacterium]